MGHRIAHIKKKRLMPNVFRVYACILFEENEMFSKLQLAVFLKLG